MQIYAKLVMTGVAIVVEGCDFYGFLYQLWSILLWAPTRIVLIPIGSSCALLPVLSRAKRWLTGCPSFGPLATIFRTWLRTII